MQAASTRGHPKQAAVRTSPRRREKKRGGAGASRKDARTGRSSNQQQAHTHTHKASSRGRLLSRHTRLRKHAKPANRSSTFDGPPLQQLTPAAAPLLPFPGARSAALARTYHLDSEASNQHSGDDSAAGCTPRTSKVRSPPHVTPTGGKTTRPVA